MKLFFSLLLAAQSANYFATAQEPKCYLCGEGENPTKDIMITLPEIIAKEIDFEKALCSEIQLYGEGGINKNGAVVEPQIPADVCDFFVDKNVCLKTACGCPGYENNDLELLGCIDKETPAPVDPRTPAPVDPRATPAPVDPAPVDPVTPEPAPVDPVTPAPVDATGDCFNFKLFNADTDTFVQDLVDGAFIAEPSSVYEFGVQAIPVDGAAVHVVQFYTTYDPAFTGNAPLSDSQTENQVPYFNFGNNPDNEGINGEPLLNGVWTVQAIAFGDDDIRQRRLSGTTTGGKGATRPPRPIICEETISFTVGIPPSDTCFKSKDEIIAAVKGLPESKDFYGPILEWCIKDISVEDALGLVGIAKDIFELLLPKISPLPTDCDTGCNDVCDKAFV